jgi:hypothetical protein
MNLWTSGLPTDVNMADWNDPPRAAMDYAAAAKNFQIMQMLRAHGAVGLCVAGPHGGFVARP